MKSYPSITTDIRADVPIFAFDKLDGSQIRVEWTKKSGFVAFGTRTRALEASHPWLGEAITLARDRYEAAVGRALVAGKVQKATLYFELLGPGSFAGRHQREPHDLVLIDVDRFGRGLIPPDEFIAVFGDLHVPRLLYRGLADPAFVAAVRDGALPGLGGEGVVCKSTVQERRVPVMFKSKTRAWLARLREDCGADEAMYTALA